MTISEQISPLYTVYYYTDFLYRVVKFKRSSDGIRILDPDKPDELPMEKFMQSYCRARSMVLQYALCNDWDYFITITVNPDRFDRWDLDRIYSYMSQWFRDYRKKHGKSCIRYVLVPEHHKDGAWHFHGLISGIPRKHISDFVPGIHPQKLVVAGYKNWGPLANAVGFVSLSPLRNPVGAAFYVVKYITKEHARSDFYQHLYYCSRGLKTAHPVADCYTYDSGLESALEFENDFCACGWVREADFTFPLQDPMQPRIMDFLVPVRESELACEDNLTFVQLTLAEWLESGGGSS